MSISRAKKDEIKLFLLKHIFRADKQYIENAIETYGISKPTVYSYLKQMTEENIITKNDDPKAFQYSLVKKTRIITYKTSEALEEDRIFNNDILPLLSGLGKNVFDIWRYSFTEMMNNAIEHANAETIRCLILKNALITTILIHDDGIGIFNKIKEYYSQSLHEEITLDDAVAMLFAGKLTTDSKRHTGEGIFFTSRAVDEFNIYSENKVFAHNVFSEGLLDFEESKKGTIVAMRQENISDKDLGKIMDLYTDAERGFFKTQFPIAQIFPNGYPVSRSEARRLGIMIQKFEEATLDFAGVENLGQGFTHELFVVFKEKHPNIELVSINASPKAEKMIERVLNTNR